MNTQQQLEQELAKRILIIDGAMGTMIQKHKLTEEDYRGERFANYPHPLKGNNDLLVLTQPQIIKDIHLEFLQAGADILETNTFNANEFSMADYHMQDLVGEINIAAAQIARQACNEFMAANPERKVYVAGALGPTNRSASLSPDVNNPGYRAVNFDDLHRAYQEQALALIEGGVDILLVETVFDTLNCKAALYAINELREEKGIEIPLMVSGTITDRSGRTLSGQTPEAFWISIMHANVLSVGLNCALGADEMAPFIREISQAADIAVSCYPNAGLPNEFGEYDHTPEHMAAVIDEWCKQGLLNVVGGCCGTTPAHIKAIAQVAAQYKPRTIVKQTVA